MTKGTDRRRRGYSDALHLKMSTLDCHLTVASSHPAVVVGDGDKVVDGLAVPRGYHKWSHVQALKIYTGDT